jgi:predicted esterase
LTNVRSFLAQQWRSQGKFPDTKFIFPNATSIPITINGGFHTLIQAEIDAGIPTERIVLGGFSQGGAMSLMAGVTCPTKLGGIFGLSCYLLLKDKVREMVPADSPNKDTPIFMGHGDADPVVKYAWGQMTADKLKEWGWNVDFKTYAGLPHSAAPKEIDDLEAYLNKRIPDVGGN